MRFVNWRNIFWRLERRSAFPLPLRRWRGRSNTFLAHRLIWYAGQQGRQDAVVESLFRGYFTEGADIGSVPVLGQLAGRAGIAAAAVELFLQSEDGTKEVKAEEAAGHRLGIRGVPYFVLNQASGISGAQPVDVFVSAIERASTHLSGAADGSTSRR